VSRCLVNHPEDERCIACVTEDDIEAAIKPFELPVPEQKTSEPNQS